MKLLVDTQAWLWMQLDPERLSARARRLVVAPEQELFLSVASGWEIAIKYQLGKLTLPEPPSRYVPDRMRALRVQSLPITLLHVLRVEDLPRHHRDPFDRLLVAQAQTERMPILSGDRIFAKYEVDLVRA